VKPRFEYPTPTTRQDQDICQIGYFTISMYSPLKHFNSSKALKQNCKANIW